MKGRNLALKWFGWVYGKEREREKKGVENGGKVIIKERDGRVRSSLGRRKRGERVSGVVGGRKK